VRRAARPLPAVVLLLSLVAPVAGQPAAAPRPDWRGTGVVLALLPAPSDLHATRPVIVIHHDPIPGLMEEAMAMPFIAASPALFDSLRAGDRIAFGLRETPDALLVVAIDRLPR
jgi:Cu/Ag efflux protein CusF